MKNKTMKYDGRGSHRRAILHMIGQSVEVFREYPTIRDISGWMNVSKPTARKYLSRLMENEEIIMFKKPYKNTEICHFDLFEDIRMEFENNVFKNDYKLYAQRVMRVILTDE